MSRKKVAMSVYLTAEQEEKLREIAKRTRVALSIYVRDGIDMVIAREEAIRKQSDSD